MLNLQAQRLDEAGKLLTAVGVMTGKNDSEYALRMQNYLALTSLENGWDPASILRYEVSIEIPKADGRAYSFRFADMQEIDAKTRPALAANGLSTIAQAIPDESGVLLLLTLAHSAGDALLGKAITDWHSARDLAQLVQQRTGLPMDELTEKLFSRVGDYSPAATKES